MQEAIISRPILFSGPMVRAILEGRKTQTRRIVKPQPDGEFFGPKIYHPSVTNRRGDLRPGAEQFGIFDTCGEWSITCPYGKPGDRLWVREAHAIYRDAHARDEGYEVILYRADAAAYWNMHPLDHIEAEFNPLRDTSDYEPKWTPSIHMPRWASRITLEITRVRVERLQEISREDVRREGVPETAGDWDQCPMIGHEWDNRTYCEQWQWLWEKINGPESWAANPWVWVIEFKVITP